MAPVESGFDDEASSAVHRCDLLQESSLKSFDVPLENCVPGLLASAEVFERFLCLHD